MPARKWSPPHLAGLIAVCALLAVAACTSTVEEAPRTPTYGGAKPQYRIGAGDKLDVNVWRNEDLSLIIPVRPDGLIAFPLVGDVLAAGKTPGNLAQELEVQLARFIREPKVVINVQDPVGDVLDQVRMTGEVTTPRAILFRHNMTLLDALIEVGGLTKFADGNRTILIRRAGETQRRYRVRLGDLLDKGDVSANIELAPGDVLVVPESFL